MKEPGPDEPGEMTEGKAAATHSLRTLILETVAVADALIAPDFPGNETCPTLPKDTPQHRFDSFLDVSDCLDDRESGARLYFGVLCHAYALHAHMGVLGDPGLADAARRAAGTLCAMPDEDVPAWLRDSVPKDMQPETVPVTDAEVYAFLRDMFGNALAFAGGYCGEGAGLPGVGEDGTCALVNDGTDIRWWASVLERPH